MAILRCENCGAMLKPEEGRFTATCEYCGAEMSIFESTAEFEIDSKGVLVQYNGKGGDVIVPEEVRVIGKECFCDNDRIFSVQLPDSVTEIQKSAFTGCTNMEKVNLPDGLETLANQVFRRCSSLKEITVPEGVLSLKKSVFCECASLSSVKLGAGIRMIGDWVFGDCAKLEYIELPPNIISLGQYCFKNCSSLKKIEVNNNLQSIGQHAFEDCIKLEEFTCSKNLVKIEYGTFQGCISLKKIEFNDGLECVDAFAFHQCTSLTGQLRFPPSLIRLDSSVLGGVFSTYPNITSIFIGGKMKTIDVIFKTPNVESIHFNEGVENIVHIICQVARGKIQQISFPQTLRTIGDSAFTYCESLKEVTLPDSLTSIGEDTFYGSGLCRVVVPDRLKHKFSDYNCEVITTSQMQQRQQQLLYYEKKLKELEKKLDPLRDAKNRIECQLKKLYESRSQYQEKLKALGFFDRSRKKEYTTEIEKLDLQRSNLNSERDNINSDIKEIESLKKKLNNTKDILDLRLKPVCQICGYVHKGYAAPEMCPICRAPADRFRAEAKSTSTALSSYTSSSSSASSDYLSSSSYYSSSSTSNYDSEEWNRLNDDLDAIQSAMEQEYGSDWGKDL